MTYDQLKRDADEYTPFLYSTTVDRLAAFGVEMLPFADDSPITEEALRAEGFALDADDDWRLDGWLILQAPDGSWVFRGHRVATMGQLRHLLAAMKGGGT